jgi:hypothetical protein
LSRIGSTIGSSAGSVVHSCISRDCKLFTLVHVHQKHGNIPPWYTCIIKHKLRKVGIWWHIYYIIYKIMFYMNCMYLGINVYVYNKRTKFLHDPVCTIDIQVGVVRVCTTYLCFYFSAVLCSPSPFKLSSRHPRMLLCFPFHQRGTNIEVDAIHC